MASDTILDGDYVRGFSYAELGGAGYWDRRGVSFGNHGNQSANLLRTDNSAKIYSLNDFLNDDSLLFKTSVDFVYEANSQNLGLFSANMAPTGSAWTVVED